MKIYLSALTLILFHLLTITVCGQDKIPLRNEKLPAWTRGEMEIHHINTGKGEGVFCIFPDGTTMLIDAGDESVRADPQLKKEFPDETGRPGERIGRYITDRLPKGGSKTIDYVLLTHFHTDHMGTPSNTSPKTTMGGDYRLSGLTDVGELLKFGKMVDRDWPAYQNQSPGEGHIFKNYQQFIAWNIKNRGMQMEGFLSGSNQQFRLLRRPEKYPDFEIRNIIANGELWTGMKNETRKLIPKGEEVHENKLSAGIRISYGSFDYFNGGDITGRIPPDAPQWLDIETPVGQVLGPVEVCEANHHAWIDAMNEPFLSNSKPQIIVIQVWGGGHLSLPAMKSMTDKKLNPDLQHIIPTNIPETSKTRLGNAWVKELTGDGGHVVIKVGKGGKKYRVFLLNDKDESFTVKSVYGPFKCR